MSNDVNSKLKKQKPFQLLVLSPSDLCTEIVLLLQANFKNKQNKRLLSNKRDGCINYLKRKAIYKNTDGNKFCNSFCYFLYFGA